MRNHQHSLTVWGLILFGVVFWAFWPACQNGFVNYDDNIYITENSHLQEGLSAASIRWAFTTRDASNWHPLTWLSYLADYELHGAKPEGYHLTNVLIHSLNAVLLFVFLGRLTGTFWRSLLVAAIFALHPLRVESVAWIAERKDVLSTLFVLLALLAYTRYASPKIGNRKSEIGNYLLSLVCFALSLMSKPMYVTLPGLLLLLDFWPMKRFTIADLRLPILKKLIGEKLPFLLLAAVSCVITYTVQKQGGALELMSGLPPAARLQNIPVSYCRYLGKLFWPESLAVIYPVVNPWPVPVVIVSVLGLLAATVAAIRLRTTRPYFLVGWLWFLGMLIPVIGLVAIGEQSMADRYTYFPTIGIILMVVWAVADLTQGWRWQKVGGTVLSIAVLACLFAITRENIGYWKNSEALFQHAVAVTQNNYSAHCNLGNYYLSQGNPEEALKEFQTAVMMKPDSAENHCNLGVVLAETGRLDDAIAELTEAVQRRPDYGMAHLNLGIALEAKGSIEAAAKEYTEAVRLMPGSAAAHNSLGVALAKRNRLDEALAEFQAAVRLDPTFAPAQGNLKMALQIKNAGR